MNRCCLVENVVL